MGKSTPPPATFPMPDSPAIGNAGANTLNQAIAAPQAPVPKVPTLQELMGGNSPQSPVAPQLAPENQWSGRHGGAGIANPDDWEQGSKGYNQRNYQMY